MYLMLFEQCVPVLMLIVNLDCLIYNPIAILMLPILQSGRTENYFQIFYQTQNRTQL